uniref:IS3 family transposase n=1 Tax=Kitasatospora sp. NBC_01519 TaxID=2903576 RepID=UPI002F91119C
MTEHIRRIHADSHETYGSPLVHAVLRREGTRVGRKRAEPLMRQAELQGVSPRRPHSHTRRAAGGAPPRTWCSATSPQPPRTGCGFPGEVPRSAARAARPAARPLHAGACRDGRCVIADRACRAWAPDRMAYNLPRRSEV